MSEEAFDFTSYFRLKHHEAVFGMRDAHRIASGDLLAAARLLEALSVPEVTDEQAALATKLSEIIELGEEA